MRLLLDTHTLIWWVSNSGRLSRAARNAIRDPANEVLVSAASAWEIATKHRIGRLPEAGPLATEFSENITIEGFIGLPISVRDGEAAGRLPGPHRDPFDRILMAQALTASLTLVSNERLFDRYGVARLW
jgi:PIN domain nuclease of toxin-antitoxin system